MSIVSWKLTDSFPCASISGDSPRFTSHTIKRREDVTAHGKKNPRSALACKERSRCGYQLTKSAWEEVELFPYFKERLACFDRTQARGSQSSPHSSESRRRRGSHNRDRMSTPVCVSNDVGEVPRLRSG